MTLMVEQRLPAEARGGVRWLPSHGVSIGDSFPRGLALSGETNLSPGCREGPYFLLPGLGEEGTCPALTKGARAAVDCRDSGRLPPPGEKQQQGPISPRLSAGPEWRVRANEKKGHGVCWCPCAVGQPSEACLTPSFLS